MMHDLNHLASKLHVRGINEPNRALLERLHRDLSGAFDARHASKALGVDVQRARQLLAYLARRGWLSRVRHGLYVAVPLDTRRPGEWLEDSWVVAERTFSPCYIGGWTACEHWSLTDQLFRTVLVITGKKIRNREPIIQGTPFRITVRSPEKLFGTVKVWRDQVRVLVSDPSRTIVDLLDDPTLGGGIRHVADIVHEYFAGEHRNDDALVEYADRFGNRAVFKRLGYTLEHLGLDTPGLVQSCLDRRSAGLVRLDPSVHSKGHIVRRWGISANVVLEPLRDP